MIFCDRVYLDMRLTSPPQEEVRAGPSDRVYDIRVLQRSSAFRQIPGFKNSGCLQLKIILMSKSHILGFPVLS